MTTRREVIGLLGATAATRPLAVRAQQPGKLPTVGYLGSVTASANSQWTATFVKRLHELGWVEHRTVNIVYRSAEGRADRAGEIAAEFTRMGVDVIVVQGTSQVEAARRATATTPIVFATAADPVGTGLVASLARPGGNITGLSLQTTDLACLPAPAAR
jgi:putative ABC transport system substrate-binding protein